MPIPGDYRRPDVFVVESAEAPRLLPVATSTGGMVGQALRGRTDKAFLVGSWGEFKKYFGGFTELPDAHLLGTLAVYYHFLNGGGPLRYVRVTGNGGAVASSLNFPSVDVAGALIALDVYAQSIGAWGNAISVETRKFTTSTVAGEVVVGDVVGASPPVKCDVQSLSGIEVGDVLCTYDAADAWNGHCVVANMITDPENYGDRGLVAGSVYLMCGDDVGLGGALVATDVLRSASRHRASTRLTATYVGVVQSIQVASVSGFQAGSYVSVVHAAMNNDLPTRDASWEGHARVVAVAGNVLTLEGPLRDSVDAANATAVASIPVDTKAYADVDGNIGIAAADLFFTATANVPGSDGNQISYQISAGIAEADIHSTVGLAAATVYDANGVYIHVVGNHIHIVCRRVVDGAPTIAQVIAAVNATQAAGAQGDSRAASAALVLAATAAGGATVFADADTKVLKSLTGGAYTRVVSQEFHLTVREAGDVVETHEFLSTLTQATDGINNRLGGTTTVPSDDNQSTRVTVLQDATLAVVPADTVMQHVVPRDIPETLLTGGVADTTPTDVQALGDDTQGSETGIYLLESEEDIDFVAMPGFTGPMVLSVGAAFAQRNYITFLGETPQSDSSFDAIVNYIQGELGVDSSYLAVHTPWITVRDPRDSTRQVEVPPGGFVTADWSVFASTRGPHVAPANRAWAGPIELAIRFTPAQRDVLNEIGVNPVRHVRNSGFRMFGTRTRYGAGDSRKFVPVRRWLNYVERTILESFGSLLFQPANTSLMRDIEFLLDDFLAREHTKGALYPGDDPTRAYAVKCDAETTDATDLTNGQVNIEVQVSPVTPAEKLVFGINVQAGGIVVTESVA